MLKYRIDICGMKCFCTYTHSHAASIWQKTGVSYMKNNLLTILRNNYLSISYHLKYMENKGNIALDTFLHFADVIGLLTIIIEQLLLHEKEVVKYVFKDRWLRLHWTHLERPYTFLPRKDNGLQNFYRPLSLWTLSLTVDLHKCIIP